MARPSLRRGEHSQFTFDVREPGGKWIALVKRPAGYKPPRGSSWRARCSLRTADRTMRVTAEDRTKGLATQALAAKIEQLRARDGRISVGDTLGDLITRYRGELLAGRVPRATAQRTIDTYEGIIRRWCLPPGNTKASGIRLSELTAGDLNREQQRIADEGGWSQVPHIRAIWRVSLQNAVDDGLIATNHAMLLGPRPVRPKKPARVYKNNSERRRDDALTDEQLTHLLEVAYADESAARTGWADVLAMSAMLGQRIGEIVSQRWEDVHLEASPPYLEVTGKLVRIKRDPVTGEGGLVWEASGKSDLSLRSIPLTEEAVALLRRRREALRAEASPTLAQLTYVFPGRGGTVPNADNAAKRIRRLMDKAGLPWATNHTIRRTVEMRLLAAGVTPLDAQKVLGHTHQVAWESYMDRTSLPTGALRGLEGVQLPAGSTRQLLDSNSGQTRDSSGS